MKKITTAIVILIIAWMVGCFVAFLFMPIAILIGAPSWLPLPWSDFDDFVETSDGKVFVDVKFYNRVLCYDENGKFVASYPYPPEKPKVTGLAVNQEGHILFRARNKVYIYNSSWVFLEKNEGEDSVHRRWRLGEDGRPIYVNINVKYPRIPDTVAEPGDYLFRHELKRTTFRCRDGSQLVRDGNGLKRYSKTGEIIEQYHGPWLLSMFTFPWPAALAWPLAFLFAYIDYRRKTILETEKNIISSRIKKQLLADVFITIIICAISVAAIVIGGSVVVFLANALPKSNVMHFWLVPLVVIPYWIVIVVTALFTWRRLLNRSKRTRAGHWTK